MGENKSKRVLAEVQRIAVFYRKTVGRNVFAEEVFQNKKCFYIPHQRNARVCAQKLGNTAAMIGFHMLYHKVIGSSSVKLRGEICKPLACKAAVYGVHYGDFFVQNDVTVVRHTVGNNVLPLK